GGNAVDAAIALSFAISVHRPFSTGLGGGGFMVIHDGPTGKSTIIDMRETAPAAATRDMYLRDGGAVIEASRWGGLAVATPGLVAGLHEAHRSHGSGKLGWRRLVEPSVAL